MENPLRAAVTRWWSSLRRWRSRMASDEGMNNQTTTDRDAARARFWAELRAGQREAEAYSARRRS